MKTLTIAELIQALRDASVHDEDPVYLGDRRRPLALEDVKRAQHPDGHRIVTVC